MSADRWRLVPTLVALVVLVAVLALFAVRV